MFELCYPLRRSAPYVIGSFGYASKNKGRPLTLSQILCNFPKGISVEYVM